MSKDPVEHHSAGVVGILDWMMRFHGLLCCLI